MHEAAREAVERARTGGGPSAIEVDTCRFYGHHSGDAQLYRGKDEVRRLRDERDCLKHFRRRVGEAAARQVGARRGRQRGRGADRASRRDGARGAASRDDALLRMSMCLISRAN